MWVEEGEKSVELYTGSSKSKSPSFYPQRVSLSISEDQNLRKSTGSLALNSDSEPESSLDDHFSSNSEVVNEVRERYILHGLVFPFGYLYF